MTPATASSRVAPKAVVLVSGGLDSTTCLALALAEGFEVIALSFDYGQRHRLELKAAERVVQHYQLAAHHVLALPGFRQLGGSALTDMDLAVPTAVKIDAIGAQIPVTYVPARNLIFLAYAGMVAEVCGAQSIFIGVNARDYSGYPDCRPAFIQSFAQTLNLGTKQGVLGEENFVVRTPLLEWSKAEIIQAGTKLSVPYQLTVSCYQPTEDIADKKTVACGMCEACVLRRQGFLQADVHDPTFYRE